MIESSWASAELLFQFAGELEKCSDIGCLTMIRTNSNVSIRVEHLPVFAEWQRRLDVELGRV